ncbi:Cytochrome oxidase assembly [Verrucomicrobia bacterium]|nr:Cytochrome oxidase assembly [Verrucomicrobiota bacterium]
MILPISSSQFESALPVNRALHRFAVITAASTLALIGVGGLVTSRGVGMAVPDWPNTYGYNMFFFPVSKWAGGIFYEHTHRLAASAVGSLTSILALWLYGKSARPFMRWAGLAVLVLGGATWLARPQRWEDSLVSVLVGSALLGASFLWPRCEASPVRLRRLGLVAFFAVVVQGVLGGLRVVLLEDQIGIFHALLAQLFFVLLCALALFTSPWWERTRRASILPRPDRKPVVPERPPATDSSTALSGSPALTQAEKSPTRTPSGPRPLLLGTTLLIFFQLALGASMRHQHAGLAVPDFPLAYGKLWPSMDAASIAHYNQLRMETVSVNPITAFQVGLHMVHRVMAVLIAVTVVLCVRATRRRWGSGHPVSKLSLVWVGLIALQVGLGAATVLSNKAADIATAHVLTGALALALGAIACIVSFGEPVEIRLCEGEAKASRALSQQHFATGTAGLTHLQ